MSAIERGDRVQHVQQAFNPLRGEKGTVTHFHGDLGDNGWPGYVLVQFDNGKRSWIEIELLVKI